MGSHTSYFVFARDPEHYIGHIPTAGVVGPIKAASAVEAVQQLVDITGEHGYYYAVDAGEAIEVRPKAELR
jgi:hypothetical protein